MLIDARPWLAGYGNLGGLLLAIVFTGGLLSATTRDVWRIVGWCLLDAAVASATIAFVGFWVMAVSAREVSLATLFACSFTLTALQYPAEGISQAHRMQFVSPAAIAPSLAHKFRKQRREIVLNSMYDLRAFHWAAHDDLNDNSVDF
jgi:hypothetical protein